MARLSTVHIRISLVILSLILQLQLFPAYSGQITLKSAQREIRLKNFSKAKQQLLQLAKLGNIESQYLLGVLYRNGHGLKKEPKKAFHWFLQAARKKHVKAQYEIALMYKDAISTEQDIDKAIYWFKKAASQNHLKAKRHLKILKSNAKKRPLSYQSAVHAVKKSDVFKLKKLFKKSLLKRRDNQGNTLLHIAAIHYQPEIIAILIKKGSNVNLVNHNKDTALNLSLESGRTSIHPALINKKTINHRNKNKITPLMLAVRYSNADTVKLLLKKGAKVNLKDAFKNTATDYSIKLQKQPAKKVLLSYGGKTSFVNKKSKRTILPATKSGIYKGWTNLMIAAWKGDLALCKRLLKKKANINKQDRH